MMKTGFPKDFLWGGAMASSQAEGAFCKMAKGWIRRICGISTPIGRRKSAPKIQPPHERRKIQGRSCRP